MQSQLNAQDGSGQYRNADRNKSVKPSATIATLPSLPATYKLPTNLTHTKEERRRNYNQKRFVYNDKYDYFSFFDLRTILLMLKLIRMETDNVTEVID